MDNPYPQLFLLLVSRLLVSVAPITIWHIIFFTYLFCSSYYICICYFAYYFYYCLTGRLHDSRVSGLILFFYCSIFIVCTIANICWINEWIQEKCRVEKSLWVQGCFGPALRLKINTQKLRKMDNDRACVHLLIILKSVIIRNGDVNWWSAAVGIDAPNLRWLKTKNWCPWRVASG